ncbi:MAG: TolC family protein [Bryobacteraceae bacterium]
MTRLFFLISCAAVASAQTAVPDPLSLREALRIAETASPDLQLARLKALEAQAQARVAGSALGPQLALHASQRYQTTNLGNIGLGTDALSAFGLGQRIGPFRVFDARPRLTQVVLDLSMRATAQAALLTAQAAGEDSGVVAEQTRYMVVQLYLRALQAEARRMAAESRLAGRKAVLDHAEETYAAGTVDRLEVTRGREAYERERLSGILAARDRDTLITMLLKTVGAGNVTSVKLEPVPPLVEPQIGTVNDALESRTELRVLRTRALAADAEIRAAERERLPRIDGIGDFGVLGADPARNVSTWLVGASLSIPLWTNRRIENNIQAAKARKQSWEEQRRQFERQVRQEVAQAMVERDAARQTLDAASRRLAAARETLGLVRMRVEAGLAPQLELLASQSSMAEAEEDRVGAQFDGWLASASLAHARGDSRLFLAPQ